MNGWRGSGDLSFTCGTLSIKHNYCDHARGCHQIMFAGRFFHFIELCFTFLRTFTQKLLLRLLLLGGQRILRNVNIINLIKSAKGGRTFRQI